MRYYLRTALLMSLMAVAAEAQPAPPSTNAVITPSPAFTNAPSFEGPINQQNSFGLGPMIGEPFGLGAKLWLSDKMAVDAGAGWSFEDRDGFQLHADFLYHAFDLFHVDQGELPLYFGVGGRVKFVDNGDNRAGIRFPIGVAYLIPRSRWEVFAEVAPILDLAPSTSLQWNGGIGFRYYFH